MKKDVQDFYKAGKGEEGGPHAESIRADLNTFAGNIVIFPKHVASCLE